MSRERDTVRIVLLSAMMCLGAMHVSAQNVTSSEDDLRREILIKTSKDLIQFPENETVVVLNRLALPDSLYSSVLVSEQSQIEWSYICLLQGSVSAFQNAELFPIEEARSGLT